MIDVPTELLERDDPLAQLAGRVAALSLDSGTPGGCVALCGEAGLGKTSLLQALRRRCPPTTRWLWGTCEPLLSPPPLAPLLDMLPLLPPSLAAMVRGGGRMAELLSGMLAVLADSRTPLVLVVEDVHWADGATLDLLRYLARRIEATRALLVITWRDDELAPDHGLHAVLAGLPLRSTLRLVLQPLSPQAVAELARRCNRSADGLHRVTAGNPFFVSELLASGAGDEGLPATVRDAVLARTRGLSPAARQLLDLVSVMPGAVETALLQALMPEAAGALPECLAARMLFRDDDGLRFRHQLAQRALASVVPPARARGWHEAAFRWLDPARVGAARRLHHAERAELPDEVLRLAPEAAREASQSSAHRQAVALYALALQQSSALTLAQQAALEEAYADECLLTNQPELALQALQRAQRAQRALQDRPAQGRVLRAQSQVLWLMQRCPEAQACAHQALPLLREGGDRASLARAYATLAQVHLHDADLRPALVWGRHAVQLADGCGDARILVDALNSVACAHLRQADRADAWTQLERSLALARSHELPGLAARAWANLATLGMVHRRLPQVLQWCAEAIAWCDMHELDLFEVRLRVRRAHAWLLQGQWAEADDEAAGILAGPTLSPIEREQAQHLRQLVALRRGDEAPALLQYWHEMIDGQRQLAVEPWHLSLALVRVEAAWLLGRTDDARRLAGAAMADAHEPYLRGQLACWWVRSGGAAAEVPERALAPPCQAELSGPPGRAAALWAELGCPWEQALAALADGEAGQRLALALAEQLGAAGLLRRVRRSLRSAGARSVPRGPYRAARSDPLGLTGREREVWQWLGQGLSNRAIAQRLHRSERTVEHHVSSLLAKLGTSDRAEAQQRWQAQQTR